MTRERKNPTESTPSPSRVRTYGSADRAAEGAQNLPASERELQARRYASVPHPPQSQGSPGLLPLQSPGMLAGGGLLVYLGLKNWRSFFGLGLAGVGSGLIYSALKENRVFDPDIGRRLLNTMATKGSQIDARIVVARPVEEVWAGWRNFENLGACMEHIEAVRRIDDKLWHWIARVPRTDTLIQWDAEIIDEVENELLVWRTIAGSELNNEGMVEFIALPDGQNTEIHIKLVYFPPAGAVGQSIANLFGGLSGRFIENELRNFKSFIELDQLNGGSKALLNQRGERPAPGLNPRPN